MSDVSFTPERIVEIVADTRHTAVTFNLTFGLPENFWAKPINDCLGGVNEWQALGDGILGQTVLAGQDSGGFLKDKTKLSGLLFNIIILTLVLEWSNAAYSCVEGRVDSIEGDARV